MGTIYSIAEMFGESLAELLAGKITAGYPAFDSKRFVSSVATKTR